MDEKPNKYEHLPIPTYEEATSSRPGSSQSRVGPEETSDDAERQGLLGHGHRQGNSGRRGNYEAPTVESARTSFDSLDGLEVVSEDGEVRREMQEMDFEDVNNHDTTNRSLLSNQFKRFANFSNPFPSIRLPSLSRFIPSISWPKFDWETVGANRFIILVRLFGVMMIIGVIYVLVASDLLSVGHGGLGGGQIYDPESVKAFLQGGFRDPTHIGRHLKHLTKYPHMAGSEGAYVLGEYIAEIFKEAELEDVHMEQFDVYLNYPRADGRGVAIVEPEDQKWQAKLEEDHEETPVFHGHSKSGNVTGHLVYANYGSREDFKKLEDMGISVAGSIALVRYYGSEGDRALKVKAAELAGAVGCIIYSDPVNEGPRGPNTEPGRFLPFDGTQRGAVSLMSWVVGDVLSPGWASTPSEKNRITPEESAGLVKIPSIPLSWRDAQHLLNTLKGHGKQMDGSWAGMPDTEYWTGDAKSPKVNLRNEQDEVSRQPIYNVLGRITGWEQPDKKIVVGNHRDAWCLGAADPGSGTAVMLHLVRIFGDLRRMGWRPFRTIEFASWDGEEYNLIGSTEHVENRIEDLRKNGIIYLNVDVGATGMKFNADASPIFGRPLRHAMGRVSDPASNKTLLEVWDESKQTITSLGAGSDYVAFQDIVGTSSIDMGFEGEKYPYHSCYDNYDWMERFGDPSWEYSAALGQVWGLLILDFADQPLLPFDLHQYTDSLNEYVETLDTDTDKRLNLQPIRNAIAMLKSRVDKLNRFDDAWNVDVYGAGGFEASLLTGKRRDRNDRVANFESNLLDLSEGGGLVNRTQFKHVVFAPQTWSGYDGETFPSIRQWTTIGDWKKAQEAVVQVAIILGNATLQLEV